MSKKYSLTIKSQGFLTLTIFRALPQKSEPKASLMECGAECARNQHMAPRLFGKPSSRRIRSFCQRVGLTQSPYPAAGCRTRRCTPANLENGQHPHRMVRLGHSPHTRYPQSSQTSKDRVPASSENHECSSSPEYLNLLA